MSVCVHKWVDMHACVCALQCFPFYFIFLVETDIRVEKRGDAKIIMAALRNTTTSTTTANGILKQASFQRVFISFI